MYCSQHEMSLTVDPNKSNLNFLFHSLSHLAASRYIDLVNDKEYTVTDALYLTKVNKKHYALRKVLLYEERFSYHREKWTWAEGHGCILPAPTSNTSLISVSNEQLRNSSL